MASNASPIPDITDDDIEWVRELMALDAFDATRRAFLTSRTTLDVSACPGSGKTTLIVAKLAILARKWPHRSKGICVLSHTNVAREEIERRLGHTVVGQQLLGYPHFIDTIHGFANRFLALPWLLSNGFPSHTIDDSITAAYRRRALTNKEYWTVQNYLTQKYSSFEHLRISKRNLEFGIGDKAFPAGPESDSFKFSKRAVETSAKAGYFCYDEMFVWAHALLEDYPEASSWIMHRFPFVVIDEMQDTSSLQGSLLRAVFPRNSPTFVIQRVGDPNQEIFDDGDTGTDQDDPYPDPDPTRNLVIPNSYRFGPEIAAFASPFAVTPVGDKGLCGISQNAVGRTPGTCPHAVIVFPDDRTEEVLATYGKHVLSYFDDNALAGGAITAVGAVHREALEINPGHDQFPKSVPHYWGQYSSETSRKDAHPSTLIQYVRMARSAAQSNGELVAGVNKIASGLIRLADITGDIGHFKHRARTHRTITELLAEDTGLLEIYRGLTTKLLLDPEQIATKHAWDALQNEISKVAKGLCKEAIDMANASGFCEWSEQEVVAASEDNPSSNPPGVNICRITDGTRQIDIQLGSIHSVKGQTHLATMLLNTYWHKHSFERMLPWLTGKKSNKNGAGVQDTTRLRQTYVAMTRPTHMICIAIPRRILGNDQEYAGHTETLKSRGWHIIDIGA